ncbi:unnamed protein product [Amoebophrya sp. A25]|nr:unnamed protein product [Amoebophrya sp. A25]|eukprot:GSA25T00003316001.1
MVLDYSRWAHIGTSSSSDDEPLPQRNAPTGSIKTITSSSLGDGGTPVLLNDGGAGSSSSSKPLSPLWSTKVYSEEHTRCMKNKAPKMCRLNNDSRLVRPEHKDFFVKEMTYPQRIMLLTRFWNATESVEDRAVFIRRLIEILEKSGAPHMAKGIGGGAEILNNVAIDLAAETVTYPPQWLEYFKKRTVTEKTEIFEAFFAAMDSKEQAWLVGGLSGYGTPGRG